MLSICQSRDNEEYELIVETTGDAGDINIGVWPTTDWGQGAYMTLDKSAIRKLFDWLAELV